MVLALLIIDPQRDFCDPGGALLVPGADADIARLAALIRRLAPRIDTIHVTLDSHHLIHIAHPLFWRDADDQPPAPFTLISAADVDAGRWTPAQPELQERALHYTQALEAGGRYVLCIWPPHCLIGSMGHTVMPELFSALTEWEQERFRVVNYVSKGSALYTEHYSALRAEVVDPADPGTQLNTALLGALAQADLVAIAGEAGSHCVASTIRDLVESAGDAMAQKLVLLTDAVSPVTGFEAFQHEFIQDMTARGMRLETTKEFHT